MVGLTLFKYQTIIYTTIGVVGGSLKIENNKPTNLTMVFGCFVVK